MGLQTCGSLLYICIIYINKITLLVKIYIFYVTPTNFFTVVLPLVYSFNVIELKFRKLFIQY